VKQYLELLGTLLQQRAEAGGQLPDEEEARIAGELDRYWWAMTEAEREEVEARLEKEDEL
jgi:hypothetical protein